MSIEYDILSTGSTGNAVVINGQILVDCGVPYKTLERSGHIKNLKLVLLTHVHGDHFKPAAVRRLHEERPALLFGCCEWMVGPLLKAGVSKFSIDVLSPYEDADDARLYKGLAIIHPSFIPHDVPNCAWHIFNGKETLFYATDTSTLDSVEAKNYDIYLIEANHSQAEIEARIADKLSRGEFSYEARAAQNHLSREQAQEWLSKNAGPNSRYQFLHQHKERHRAAQV